MVAWWRAAKYTAAEMVADAETPRIGRPGLVRVSFLHPVAFLGQSGPGRIHIFIHSFILHPASLIVPSPAKAQPWHPPAYSGWRALLPAASASPTCSACAGRRRAQTRCPGVGSGIGCPGGVSGWPGAGCFASGLRGGVCKEVHVCGRVGVVCEGAPGVHSSLV